ncbi:MAG: hypothetical protein SGARI_006564, partial [Bacillariaceae sp.]
MLQMLSGMAGAFIMEDTQEDYDQAPGLQDMKEHVLVLQALSMKNLERDLNQVNYRWFTQDLIGGPTPDAPQSTLPIELENPNNITHSILFTNGQYNPSMEMQDGEVRRLRVVNALPRDSVPYVIVTTSEGLTCEMWELAKDAVYLRQGPQLVEVVFLAGGSRGDIAIQCNGVGTAELVTASTLDMFRNDILGYM